MSTPHTTNKSFNLEGIKKIQKKNYLAQEFVCHNCLIFFSSQKTVHPDTQCNIVNFFFYTVSWFKKFTLKASSRFFFHIFMKSWSPRWNCTLVIIWDHDWGMFMHIGAYELGVEWDKCSWFAICDLYSFSF